MKSLKDLIQWAEDSPKNHLDITDADTAQIINNDLNRDMAKEKSGSVENWFADMAEKGHTNIIVSYRTKKGTGWSQRKAPQLYKIGAKGAESTPERSGAVNGLPVAASASGLAMPSSPQGLGWAESANLMAKSYLLEEKKTYIEKLESKIDKLEAENEDLKTEDRAEARKAGNLKSGSDIVASLAPVLQGLAQSLKGSNAGLNSPQPQLTDTKQALYELIKNDMVTEGMAEYAYHVIDFALKGKKSFIDQYVQLVQKHTNQNAA